MRSLLVLIFASCCFFAQAQVNTSSADQIKFPIADFSPADIVYFPLNTPKAKPAENVQPVMKVVYSRPQKKGREIFGILEQFGKVWRLGANENTEIKFYSKVKIGDKKIKAGTYSLFAIPNKESWIIILNKNIDRWGAFTYDESKDVLRVEVPVQNLSKPLEYLSITFKEVKNGANMIIGWDKTVVELPIVF
ncbi:DUF2911 domain-containing protein [Pedobacter changchengzhani]|uniref:DUF2911 domain-containing protein n=1 Tax=Pedobacter changchengzhani TaxID=2529274 RepID=A0A4R5MN98_9SPHI|nr:DUF2911 domain-containing protein [Pedobacter changchengzhani]TDG37317.1 DUF2911 domain-containing protein [Pedobacter changchengzhani]